MGSFAKSLGHIARMSLETESASILSKSAANKVPKSLSQKLDGTLKKGHDMRIFGLGTMASLASCERYGRFTSSMLAVYATMEWHLDRASISSTTAPGYGIDEQVTEFGKPSPVGTVWNKFGATLRRAPSLHADLQDVGVHVSEKEELGSNFAKRSCIALSPATAAYVEALNEAGDDDVANGGGRLLGHLYCRYFADLFGGQMLRAPTEAALDLPAGTPRHYCFDFEAHGGRRALIEDLYLELNVAGGHLTPDQLDAAVDEALNAFDLNAKVYAEEPGMYVDAVKGGLNVALGAGRQLANAASFAALPARHR